MKSKGTTPEPTTAAPTPPPTTAGAAEAASDAALRESGRVVVAVTVALEMTPAALESMKAAPVAAVTSLGDGMAAHLGKPAGTVRVAATVPDLGAVGVFTFSRLRALQTSTLDVSYEVAVPPEETKAMQEQLQTTKDSASSLTALTNAINTELEEKVGVTVEGATVTSDTFDVVTPMPAATYVGSTKK